MSNEYNLNKTNNTNITATKDVDKKKVDIEFDKSKLIFVNNNFLSYLNKLALNLNIRNLYDEPHIKQGLIFGNISNQKIELTLAHPTLLSFYDSEEEFNKKVNEIAINIEKTRLDFIPLGFFFVTDDTILHKSQLNSIIKYRALNSQCLIAYYSPTTFDLKLKRLSDEIVELSSDAEMFNYKEFPIELFNKHYSSNIFEDVKYTLSKDIYSTLSVMNDESNLIYDKDIHNINSNKFLNEKL